MGIGGDVKISQGHLRCELVVDGEQFSSMVLRTALFYWFSRITVKFFRAAVYYWLWRVVIVKWLVG